MRPNAELPLVHLPGIKSLSSKLWPIWMSRSKSTSGLSNQFVRVAAVSWIRWSWSHSSPPRGRWEMKLALLGAAAAQWRLGGFLMTTQRSWWTPAWFLFPHSTNSLSLCHSSSVPISSQRSTDWNRLRWAPFDLYRALSLDVSVS